MANDYFNHGSYPATGASGSSAAMRAELDAITAGFAKLPVLAGSALKLVRVNAGATALESTNLIDGITIGSVTPAPGTFTTLASTGLATLASATVTGAATLGSATVSGALVANGNVTLGDAIGDTITIGGGSSKNAAGNWVFAAPSSGVGATFNGVAGASIALFNGGNDASTSISFQGATVQRGFIGVASGIISGGAATDFAVRAEGALVFAAGGSGADVTISSAGNVTIAAPSSGTTLAVAQFSNTAGIVLSGANGTTPTFSLLQSGIIDWQIRNTATTGALGFYAGSGLTQSISAGGNVTIAAPASGTTLIVNSVAGAVALTLQAAAASSAVLVYNLSGSTYQYQTYLDTATSSLVLARDNIVGANRLSVTSAGGVTIATPSSGITLTATGVAGGTPIAKFGVGAGASAFISICGNNTTAGTTSLDLQQDSTGAVDIVNRSNGRMSLYTNGVERVQLTTGGTVDVVGGTGKLTMAGGITRFASAEQTCPSGTTAVSVAHGGPRIPDIVRVVLRNKTTEGGYVAGDEYDITNLIDISDGTRGSNTTCDATNVVWRYTGAGITPAIRNTSNTLIAVTAANWKVVFYCHWL